MNNEYKQVTITVIASPEIFPPKFLGRSNLIQFYLVILILSLSKEKNLQVLLLDILVQTRIVRLLKNWILTFVRMTKLRSF